MRQVGAGKDCWRGRLRARGVWHELKLTRQSLFGLSARRAQIGINIFSHAGGIFRIGCAHLGNGFRDSGSCHVRRVEDGEEIKTVCCMALWRHDRAPGSCGHCVVVVHETLMGTTPLQPKTRTPEPITLKMIGAPGQEFSGFLTGDGKWRDISEPVRILDTTQ